jgi:hypothetical protein
VRRLVGAPALGGRRMRNDGGGEWGRGRWAAAGFSIFGLGLKDFRVGFLPIKKPGLLFWATGYGFFFNPSPIQLKKKLCH